jgi:hypothetical protein
MAVRCALLALGVSWLRLLGCSGSSAEIPTAAQSEDALRYARTLECTVLGESCIHDQDIDYCVEKVSAKATTQGSAPGIATITIERKTQSGRSLEPLVVQDREAMASDNLFSADWDGDLSYLSHSKRLSKWRSSFALREHELDVRCEYSSTIAYRDPCDPSPCGQTETCTVQGRGNPRAVCVPSE